MNILVTGGTGFIGSHISVALMKDNHNAIIVDNLSNSSIEIIKRINQITDKDVKFYKTDITDEIEFEKVFKNEKIDGVIHLAGYKSVSESIIKPLDYYYNNTVGTINLIKLCLRYNIEKVVFSSSASVYGNNTVPLTETMPLMPVTNPYSQTKVICEKIFQDTVRANSNLSVTILRYFNPVGAHESGLIGEAPADVPNNLMPYITKVAKGLLKKLYIYGNEYPTIDGTGIRDYIHIMDLAEGHLKAFNKIKKGINIYNLGTGKGTSVLQLVKIFENTNNIKIPYEIVSKRPGDIAQCYADVTKANKKLGWTAKRDLVQICRDAWNFEKNNSIIIK